MSSGIGCWGPLPDQGRFGSVFPIIWMDGPNEAGGQLAVVKHVAIAKPYVGPSVQELREIEITSKLRHVNVVRMLRSIQTPFAIDLILEHCICDLSHALKSSMEMGGAQEIVAQICSGLAYVHDEDVMHRDLKHRTFCC